MGKPEQFPAVSADPVAQQITREVSRELAQTFQRGRGDPFYYHTQTITLDLEVTTRFTRIPEQHETFDCPGSDACCEIESVQAGGIDITRLLDKDTLADIHEEINK